MYFIFLHSITLGNLLDYAADTCNTSFLFEHGFILADPLLIQLPGDVPGEAVEVVPGTWAPVTQVGDLRVSDSWLQLLLGILVICGMKMQRKDLILSSLFNSGFQINNSSKKGKKLKVHLKIYSVLLSGI